MSDQPLFQDMDEQERIYAPEGLPAGDPEQARVQLDEGSRHIPMTTDPPTAAPVANPGTASSAAMAPPNIGPRDAGDAPGAPDPEAPDPLDTDRP